ncbi:hypothetical protein C8F04DRAFT_943069 [Mycena alexandri]|uniref:Uncharacterized protein n=1 Tax=Mycena alexandri TaxID=1745969 RepID=A0AAD6TCE9_9AGAR|nr:hypothetical protein C8F04DRAFT_943069 [Mycena alexandri]
MSTSKGKGKEPATALPLPGPSSGSANPAASLSALWAYLLPALNHIVKSPTNTPDKAPAIDIAFYAGIHTACYNYFTSQSETKSSAQGRIAEPSGTDLYEQLDKYYIDAAREVILGAPRDDSTLIHYIVPCFNRFSAGAMSVNRLLNYINRHYVRRAVDEDKGWLRLNGGPAVTADDSREKISERLKEKRSDELKQWGYKSDGSGATMASAEACAEAASPPDRIISVSSLAHRRFRTEVFEPLLAVPVVKGTKAKNKKIPKATKTTGVPLPKGRLARAVKELLESNGGDEEERSRLVRDLAAALRLVGVRPDHPLRKRLDKFLASPAYVAVA